jgi:hypothetical protein
MRPTSGLSVGEITSIITIRFFCKSPDVVQQ